MPYASGYWGLAAKLRSKKRLEYFRLKKQGKLAEAITTGLIGETFAKIWLENSVLVDKQTHDLIWKNRLIEVKTAHATKDGKCWCFSYTQSQQRVADYFFLVLLFPDQSVYVCFLIPTSKIKPVEEGKIGNIKLKIESLPELLPYFVS